MSDDDGRRIHFVDRRGNSDTVFWCEHCADNHATQCQDGHLWNDDDVVTLADGDSVSRPYADENCFECPGNGDMYRQDDSVRIGDEWYSQDWFDAHGFYSESEGENYLRADGVECNDGEWRLLDECKRCVDGEWRENDEADEYNVEHGRRAADEMQWDDDGGQIALDLYVRPSVNYGETFGPLPETMAWRGQMTPLGTPSDYGMSPAFEAMRALPDMATMIDWTRVYADRLYYDASGVVPTPRTNLTATEVQARSREAMERVRRLEMARPWLALSHSSFFNTDTTT